MADFKGILGEKLGMTQIFDDARAVPVTVIKAGPCFVAQVKTKEKDGYTAVQLGIEPSARLSKPRAGQLGDLPKVSTLREFRVDSVDEYEVGQTLDVSLFAEGDLVDVTGVSKGKGFAGHIKRHHFKRGPKTHGSDHHREPGSIGPGTTPGRVYKGMRMAGHMGDRGATSRKLRIVRTDPERNLVLVKGTLPGARNALILLKKA